MGLDKTDPRHSSALFELAIIALSKYEDPLSTIKQGLEYLHSSAQVDSSTELRSKALYQRIYTAYNDNILMGEPLELVEKWLFEAAAYGHRTAFEDLLNVDPARAKAAGRLKANQDMPIHFDGTDENEDEFNLWIQRNIGKGGDVDQYYTTNGHSLMHWAAATGKSTIISLLHDRYGVSIDKANSVGDTPLLVAASYGQLETVMLLLELNADASLTNNMDENILHFLWCFCTNDAKDIVPSALYHGANLTQKAKAWPLDMRLDISPMLAGTPVERVAGRNRVDLVNLLVDFGYEIIPSNGNEMRRMFLWAVRLHNLQVQNFLLDYHSECSATADTDLQTLDKTMWSFKGQKVTYVCAVAAGWISGARHGIDAPYDFALACRNGADWHNALDSSVSNTLKLFHDADNQEEQVSKALELAFKASHIAAFRIFLKWKLTLTAACDHSRDRLLTLEPLTWKKHAGKSTGKKRKETDIKAM